MAILAEYIQLTLARLPLLLLNIPSLYRVRSLALQPLSAGNSAEFSQDGNSKTVQPREINLTSLDSLGSGESIYVYFKHKKLGET